jgi:twitching motility protein PilT
MNQEAGRGPGRESRTRHKVGEMLVRYRVITPSQLDGALEAQKKLGGRLGKNLIELRYITEDVFIKFLSSQLGIPNVNLNTVEISPEVQRLVPLEIVKRYGVVPLRKEDNVLHLGMTDPTDLNSIRELEFTLGLKIKPLVLAESQWDFAVRFYGQHGVGGRVMVKGTKIQDVGRKYDLARLAKELVEHKGSDIHLTDGVPPTFRIGDQLVRLNAPPLTPERIESLVYPVISEEQREVLNRSHDLDCAFSFEGAGRFRLNIFQQKNALAVAMRHINERIPSPEELALPPWLTEFANRKQGLILVVGPSGHGKSTTMACLIDLINTTRRVNIVTIEDPIEYLHPHKLSNVNQREIGTDTPSFHDGIRHIFRQDPDVIGIGEMRDLESISTALTAAETGHLVLGTLHTNNAVATIDRIIDVFPSGQQNQVRSQLSGSLLLIFSQRLIPRGDGAGRILAYEKLINSYRVQNAIRENRTFLLRSQSAMMSEDYSSIDFRLAELVKKGLVTYDEGLKWVDDQKVFETMHQKK